MSRNFEECFSELKETEESAAECIQCLKKHGEQIYFDPDLKRIRMGRELYDPKYGHVMQTISDLLKIRTLEDYQEKDREFNLTMY